MRVARIEDRLVVVTKEVGVSTYDFDFDLHFCCEHPYRFKSEEMCVLRIGPISDYAAEFDEKMDMGLRLVNSPEEHAMASELESWYPLIRDLTPRTRVFEALPQAADIESEFDWPVFLKGSRQTSKHNPDLSIVRSRQHYERVVQQYQRDPILFWQKPVVREFVSLEPLTGSVPGKVPPSVEYRSFWWNGECVGWGCYWYQLDRYESADIDNGLAIASDTATRLKVPFLAVDFAKASGGQWVVIECNDAQESGYVGTPPYRLWREVLARIEWRA